VKNIASTAATAATSGTGPVASFIRFVAFGGGTGLAASGVLLALQQYMSLAMANAIVTVVSTVVANELHSRLTFRSGERGWRMHFKSTGTVVVSYLFTTTAMMVLHAVSARPSVLTEQAVYLSASGLAGIGRFVALRVYVFATARGESAAARPTEALALAPAAAPALDRSTLAAVA
jgi:putative flippase GtrA